MRRVGVFVFWIIAYFSFTATRLSGQSPHGSHGGAGWVPDEILHRPISLRKGIGTVHEAVTTSSSEAQAFYNQGLSFTHSYVWIDAIRSFHQALRLDPNLGMAYLGLMDAYIGLQDVPAARTAFQKAESLTEKMSDREHQWMTIRKQELEYTENPGDPEKYFAYRRSVADALKSDPNDAWLWIQRGLAEEGTPFAHGQAGGVDALAFYRTALILDPDNSAAHHYYAHAFENIGRTKEALEESDIYARSAPEIPHARHMHGHELLRSGHVEEAIQEFQKTKELEDNYYRTEQIPAKYDWHHAHNLQLLAMSYQSLGQMKLAEAAFHEAFLLPASTDFLEFNRRSWPEFLLGRGRFAEAMEASHVLIESPFPLARLAGHTLAGQALLGMNRVSEAKEELSLAERESELVPAQALATLPFPATLRVILLLREKDIEEGESLAKEIEKTIRSAPGPDAWSAGRFELESIAQIARQCNDWNLAEFTAQAMIEYDPSYAGGYFALALVTKERGDIAKANQQFATAEKLWSKADQDLPELQQIRKESSAR